MTTTALLTPYDKAASKKVGRRVYRKQILPLGSITYEGRKIKFDKQFLTDLATAFQERAYDQVPFVLADADNRHNMDPERFRGDIKTLELTADGLDAIIEVNKSGAKVLEDNPKLGVSARIIEGLAKADGRTFKRAINHVLGTMDPKVTGLRPWQAVDLSNEGDDIQVVDLTTATYEEGTQVTAPATKTKDQDKPLDLSGLSDEEFEALLDAAEDLPDDKKVEDKSTTKTTDTTDTKPEVGDRPDATDPAVVEADPDADDDDDDDEPSGADLSVVLDTDTRDTVAQMRLDLATERFANERKELIRAGVPPFLLDLAEPILASPDAVTIDLSNSDKPVNATKIVRDLIEGVKGFVEVRPEVGHAVDLSESTDEEDTLMKQWDEEYGSV